MPPPQNPAGSPLLARLDALADLVHRCHGLLLAPDGQLALELLLLLGIAVGILRADGLRVRAAPLHDAWRQLDDSLRAGLLFAAWCQHATYLRLRDRCRPWTPVAEPEVMPRRGSGLEHDAGRDVSERQLISAAGGSPSRDR